MRPATAPATSAAISTAAPLTRADVMRADDVAVLLGISKRTVYHWARQGRLPCRRRGNVILFLRSEVTGWLADPDADF